MNLKRLHTSRGYSLMELLAVVLIALILSAVAVGSYATMKQRRSLRSAADNIQSAFVTARSDAISRNAWYRVVLQLRDPSTSVDKMGFWIDEIDADSNTDPNPTTLDTTIRSLVTPFQPLPEGVHFLDANINGTTYTLTGGPYLVIRFKANGSSDQAEVRLQEDSSATRTGPITSEVKLYSATAKSTIVTDYP